MSANIDENLTTLKRCLEQGRDEGADLILSPELSLSGFHRGVRQLCSTGTMARTLDAAVDLCRRHSTGALVGLPVKGENCAMTNSMIAINADGLLSHLQAKVGLTASEEQFFSPGQGTMPWFEYGMRLAVVMCREVLDIERLRALHDRVDLLLWPSYVRWDEGADDYEGTVKLFAQESKAWVMQANWSTAVNDPSIRHLGGSILVDPDGNIADVAPQDTESIQTFDLK